jgi:hypothetical protein
MSGVCLQAVTSIDEVHRSDEVGDEVRRGVFRRFWVGVPICSSTASFITHPVRHGQRLF